MKEYNQEQLINETLESFTGSKRAAPGPFLLGRILARLEQNAPESIWTRITAFISRPAVAFATIASVLLLNAGILWVKEAVPAATANTSSSTKDEFAVNTVSLYEFENQE